MTAATIAFDVYCGKDKRLSENEGNKIYKELIAESVQMYSIMKTKADKMKMTAELLEEFQKRSNGGKFYKKDNTMEWILCDDAGARDKISHALRFALKHQQITTDRRFRLGNTIPSSRTTRKGSTNANKAAKRGRSISIDLCPAAMETAPMRPQHSESDFGDDYNISAEIDPLFEYNEMVLSGELNILFEGNLYYFDGYQSSLASATNLWNDEYDNPIHATHSDSDDDSPDIESIWYSMENGHQVY
jgi:hypothetical protein